MGLMDKIKGIVNPTDVDENYEDEYVFDGPNNNEYNYDNDYHQPGNTAPQQNPYNQGNMQRGQNSGGGNANNGMAINGAALELKVIRPDRWESVHQIAQHLINRRTVVLNLEATNKETARRMIDFLLGVVFTIEGDIKKVASNTWVITPNNVDLSQEQQPSRSSPSSGLNYDNM